MLPSELTNTIEQFIAYVHRNEAHYSYICVYHTNVFEADNIYKNPPPNVISPKQNCYFFHSGAPPMTLLTAGAPTDPQLPATASNGVSTMFPGTDVPRSYVPRYRCSPVPMFPGTYVPRYLCSPVPMFPEPMFPGTYVPR